jgi:flagellar biogenesis protein FliO
MSFSRRQLGMLVLLTLVWGLNWPVMKLGVSGRRRRRSPFRR